jgi:hypothetical protein
MNFQSEKSNRIVRGEKKHCKKKSYKIVLEILKEWNKTTNKILIAKHSKGGNDIFALLI